MRNLSERALARRDALVDAHVGMVLPIALRVHASLPPSFDLDDLMASGFVALIEVATRYKPRQHGGTPFSAFARKRIRGAMLDSVRRRHFEENTRPSIDDLPGFSDDPDIERPLRAANPRAEARIEIDIDERRQRNRIAEAIGWLPEHQQAIIARYYADSNPSLATVGAALGLSEWRVVREHADAIAELRRRLRVA